MASKGIRFPFVSKAALHLQDMSERFLKKNQVIEIVIRDMAFGGVGIGKIPTPSGDFTVFVQNTIPGQFVEAQVVKAAKSYAECKLLHVLKASPDETLVPYQAIPGAPYATWPISLQLEAKKRTTLDLFRKIGKIEQIDSLLDEFITSPEIWHYRNKMEYSFSVIRFDEEKKEEVDDFALGFKHRGTWWCVENLNKDSGMFDEESENNLAELREWFIQTGLPAWHPPKRVGFFRFLVVRKSFHENRLLINLVTTDRMIDRFDVNEFVSKVRSLLGERIAGIIHTINNDEGDRVDPLNGSTNLIYGVPKIIEKINGLSFEISMQSFFQTNPKSAERLYSKVLDYAGVEDINDGDVILDLFCGTGTIAQLMAKRSSRKVLGVDIVESAIRDARENAQRNDVSNVDFHAADVGKFLLEFPEYQGKINTLVLDPPRGGIAPKTLRKVISLGAQRMVYVSCNPSTQARDAEVLAESGYVLKTISLVDQFPHTAHIESVALFEKI
ncbi:MAG: 23S rRNA (uracil(1939)-C(5))-methyltransferase RlmD [Flavobacteriales bacterium]